MPPRPPRWPYPERGRFAQWVWGVVYRRRMRHFDEWMRDVIGEGE